MRCPRCGEPYLLVKNWKKAGRLYIHGFDEQAGIRFPIGCHVSYSLRDDGAMDSNYRRGVFRTDATPGPYPGYTRGDRWNGWATPVFEHNVARRIASDTNQLDDGTSLEYDNNHDAFIYLDSAYPEADPLVFGAMKINAEGVSRTVYPIGTYYWTWEEQKTAGL